MHLPLPSHRILPGRPREPTLQAALALAGHTRQATLPLAGHTPRAVPAQAVPAQAERTPPQVIRAQVEPTPLQETIGRVISPRPRIPVHAQPGILPPFRPIAAR